MTARPKNAIEHAGPGHGTRPLAGGASKLADWEAMTLLNEMISSGDSSGLSALMSRQGWGKGLAEKGAARPLDLAVSYDDLNFFKALLGLAPSLGEAAMRRVCGEAGAVHLCIEHNAEACLSYIVAERPLAAVEDNEALPPWHPLRPAIVVAAGLGKSPVFDLLAQNLASALSHGLAQCEAVESRLVDAAFAVLAGTHDGEEAMRRLNALAAMGLNLDQARAANGQSLLGRCMARAGDPSGDLLLSKMVSSGMSLFAPCFPREDLDGSGFAFSVDKGMDGDGVCSALEFLFLGWASPWFPGAINAVLSRRCDDDLFPALGQFSLDEAALKKMDRKGFLNSALFAERRRAWAEKQALSAHVSGAAQAPRKNSRTL